MIKIEVKGAGPGRSQCKSELDGSLEELLRDTAYALNAIFNGVVRGGGPLDAVMFKNAVRVLVTDPHSPVWDLKGEHIGKEGPKG